MDLNGAREIAKELRTSWDHFPANITRGGYAAIILDDRVLELDRLIEKLCKTIQHLQHEGNIYQKRVEELEVQLMPEPSLIRIIKESGAEEK